MAQKERKRVGAIDRTLQILDILTERGEPMSTYDLSRSAGAPASTFYKIVDELVERSILSRVNEKAVWLGPRLMRYGLKYRSQISVFAIAKLEMERLAARLGETIQICARDEDMMTVIGMVRGRGHFNVASEVGTRVPLNWTASGRLLLGHLEDNERYRLFKDTAKPSDTGLAETDPKKLSELSRAEFLDRLSVQLSASEYAVACIASPIRDEAGICVATISIVLPESKARTNQAELSEEVRCAADSIEAAMGQLTTNVT